MIRRAKYQTVNGGISLVLLLFIILSLVTFAVLSIVSAKADARLSEKYMAQADQYYGACNQAQQYLAKLDGELQGLYRRLAAERSTGGDALRAAYFAEAKSFLPELDEESRATACFAVGETMELKLQLEILFPETAAGPFYRILENQTETTVEYDYDSTPLLLMQ